MPLEISTELPDSRDLILGQLITQESAVAAVVSVWQAITKKTLLLVNTMVPQLTDLDEKAQTFPIKKTEYKDLLKRVKDFAFVTYSDTLVTVPEGFTGHYVPFLVGLKAIGAELALKAPKIVENYGLELSMFLSNKDARQSLKSHDSLYKTVARERDGYYKELKGFIDPKQPTRSRVRLGSLVDRFQELEQLFYQAEQLEELRKDLRYKELLAGIGKASELLKLIKERFESGELTTASKESIKNLATGAYEIAEYMELIATYGYLVESALGATNALAEQLNDLFKRQAA